MTTEEVEISGVVKLPKGYYQVASGLALHTSNKKQFGPINKRLKQMAKEEDGN